MQNIIMQKQATQNPPKLSPIPEQGLKISTHFQDNTIPNIDS
jgi:hypothetical protein